MISSILDRSVLESEGSILGKGVGRVMAREMAEVGAREMAEVTAMA